MASKFPPSAASPVPPSGHSAAAPRPTPRAQRAGWLIKRVPIRSLAPRHRDRILAHLLALDAGDRYLRFGYPATDAHLERYVAGLDFERDELFGVFSRRLELIAIAHLAFSAPDVRDDRDAVAEFGVSVLARARHRGFGRRLFAHATLHARNRGVDTLLIYALSENAAMLAIARDAGATVVRDGAESDARLKLPPDTFASHVDALVEWQAAEFDYRFKVHARRLGRLFGTRSAAPPEPEPQTREDAGKAPVVASE